MNRLICYIILFAIALTYTYSQYDKHKVIILVKDSVNTEVVGVQFKILQHSKEIQSGTTNDEGIYETILDRGGNYDINFYTIDNQLMYNFTVPKDERLKHYKLVCRLPIRVESGELGLGNKTRAVNHLRSDTSADNNRNHQGNDKKYKANIYIILQNKDQVLLQNHKFKLYDHNNLLIGDMKTNDNGEYNDSLYEGEKYSLATEVYGISYKENFIVPRDIKSYTFRLILPFPSQNPSKQEESFAEKPDKYVRTYQLQNITFAFGSFDLTPDSYPALDSLVANMKTKPNMKIEIAGHTDNVGSDEANYELSLKRSGVIVEFLMQRGIKKNRLLPFGYGESQPIASNSTEKGRAKNRRIEVRVISE